MLPMEPGGPPTFQYSRIILVGVEAILLRNVATDPWSSPVADHREEVVDLAGRSVEQRVEVATMGDLEEVSSAAYQQVVGQQEAGLPVAILQVACQLGLVLATKGDPWIA